MQFKTTLVGSVNKNVVSIVVPEEKVTELGAGKRPKVTVTISGLTYHGNITSAKGGCVIRVSQEVQAKTGLEAGDTVSVRVEIDTSVREVLLSDEIKTALSENRIANLTYLKLSYSKQRQLVEPILRIKGDDIRRLRITKLVKELEKSTQE